jgi:membrane protein YqaA with SNARE-associated domain
MKISREIKFLLGLAFIVLITTFAFWLSEAASDNTYVQDIIAHYGYLGIFLGAVVSGFNLVIPIPAVTFVPALVQSGLDYWLSILILTLGMTVADVAAYALGRAGRGVLSEAINQKLMKRLDQLRERHRIYPFLLAFLFASLVPIPNEVLVVPLGFLRYRMFYIILALLAGNLIFNLLFSKGFIFLFGNLV